MLNKKKYHNIIKHIMRIKRDGIHYFLKGLDPTRCEALSIDEIFVSFFHMSSSLKYTDSYKVANTFLNSHRDRTNFSWPAIA